MAGASYVDRYFNPCGIGCLICDSAPDAEFVACPSCLAEYAETETYPADCDECRGRGVVEVTR